MFEYLILEPLRKRRLGLFLYRVSQILHVRTNGTFDHVCHWLLKPMRPKLIFPPSRLFPEDKIGGIVVGLRKEGYALCPQRLSRQLIEEIKRFAFTMPGYAGDPREQFQIIEGALPVRHQRVDWRMQDVTANSAVQTILFDSYFHTIAQEYLECRPLLTSVLLWLNPIFTGTHDANIFHYDNDGPAFVKFFIYLSDVTETTGPHVFIQKSHSRRKPRQFHQGGRFDENLLLEYYGKEN